MTYSRWASLELEARDGNLGTQIYGLSTDNASSVFTAIKQQQTKRERERDRQTDRQTDRGTDIDRNIERQRHRETETQTESEGERET